MNRRVFLSRVSAAIASVPLAMAAARLPASAGPEMTAAEVKARRDAWLQECAARLHKTMMTPNVQWFTLQ